jgi:hypothetical protein
VEQSHQTPKTVLCFRIGLGDDTCAHASSNVLEARYRDARRDYDKMLDGADISYARKVQNELADVWIAFVNS